MRQKADAGCSCRCKRRGVAGTLLPDAEEGPGVARTGIVLTNMCVDARECDGPLGSLS